MSSTKRPIAQYIQAAAKLARDNPHYQKYLDRARETPRGEHVELSRHEKAAIARAAKLPPIPKRDDASYIRAAKELAKFAPSLKKYKKLRKGERLTGSQKAAIAHKEKLLRYSDYLTPVTEKQAKKMKGLLYAPGIRAIRLGNTGEDAHIKKIARVTNDIHFVSNGRDFLYWQLGIRNQRNDEEPPNKKSRGKLKEAGKAALDNFKNTFPIEQIAELAQRAFKKIRTRQIFLWAEAGRVGEGFHNFDEFMQWLYESYSQYKNVERWVNGIAIELKG